MEPHLQEPLGPTIVPLVYNDGQDVSAIRNIMLIDSNLLESQLFYDSANSNTFPIKYDYTSQKSELLELLRNKFISGIDRISFVFHDPSILEKAFLDNACFFVKDDLLEGQTTFSENIMFLTSLVNEFHITHFDFLACNTLIRDNWKQYYELLNKQSGVICGASNDATGNLHYGGDWIMENTNENIKNIYFNSNIDNYASTLAATTLSQNGGTIYIKFDPLVSALGLQYSSDNVNWTSFNNNYPINIQNTNPSDNNVLTVEFTTDLLINSGNAYFDCKSSYITFDGKNKTVTVSGVTGYPGLIRNSNGGSNGYSNITIQNINTTSSNSTLAQYKGWICQSYFGKGASNIVIANCSNTGDISGNSVGGICGPFAGYDNGTATITNCYNTGVISGVSAGGICGAYAGYTGSATVNNCYSTGVISGRDAGGICGKYAGYLSGLATFTNCYSTGAISGQDAGGIAGSYAGYLSGSVFFTNCYSSGEISGSSSGGIVGPNSTAIETNCYVANGSWTDSEANTNLIETPTETNHYGNVWTDYGLADNTPYYLTSNLNNYYTTSSGGIYGIIINIPETIYYVNQTSIIEGTEYTLNVNETGYSGIGLANGIVEFTFTPDFLGYTNMTVSDGTSTIASNLIIKVLNNTINTTTTITNADIYISTIYGWPVTINGGTSSSPVVITFDDDITLNLISQYFIIGSEYITFDGQNNTVTVSGVTNYPGLIRNGTAGINGYSNITIQNINTTSSNSTLAQYKGWICQDYFGKSASNVTITNCSNTGDISGISAGGICGQYAGYDNGTATITNCYNTGVINGQFAGGIAGNQAGYNSGKATFTNCFNTGAISARDAGGIAGSYAGDSGKATFNNCYSTGVISGVSAGGICGTRAGSNNGSATFTNCYSTGVINGFSAGGIAGNQAGYNSGEATFTNCYSSGTKGLSSGGIVGPNSTAIETNCYVANGSWSDSAANDELTGEPTFNPGVGTTWTSVSIDTPYLLSAYNNALYDPSSVSTSEDTYTTNKGIQDNSIYQIINNVPTTISNSIVPGTGVITYTNLTAATIVTNVVAYNNNSVINKYYGYNINTFVVNPSLSVYISNSNELLNFMDSTSNYGIILNNLVIDYELVGSSYKVLTGDNIIITKSNNYTD